MGGFMGFWSKVVDAILGYDIVKVEDAKKICEKAIVECDANNNGYLNAREFIRFVKQLIKS